MYDAAAAGPETYSYLVTEVLELALCSISLCFHGEVLPKLLVVMILSKLGDCQRVPCVLLIFHPVQVTSFGCQLGRGLCMRDPVVDNLRLENTNSCTPQHVSRQCYKPTCTMLIYAHPYYRTHVPC